MFTNVLPERLTSSSIVVFCAATALASACHAAPTITDDGRYCFRDRRGVVKACTAHAVPDAQTDAQAHQLPASPQALSIYVIRIGESDVGHAVPLEVDGHPVAVTIPRALVRLQLVPGRHELTLSYGERREVVAVEGAAGDVRALLMRGQILISGERHWWEPVAADEARHAAEGTRLVVDARLQP